MDREKLKEFVTRVIEPMCIGEVMIQWESLENMPLLNEVIKEVLDENPALRYKLTEGAGEIHDVNVHWRLTGEDYPYVSVTYKITPVVRRLNKKELEELVSLWNREKHVLITMMTDEVDPLPSQMLYSLKFHNIELMPVEIVYADGCMVARCLRDIHGKEARKNQEMYHKIYQDALFGENGIIPQMLK